MSLLGSALTEVGEAALFQRIFVAPLDAWAHAKASACLPALAERASATAFQLSPGMGMPFRLAATCFLSHVLFFSFLFTFLFCRLVWLNLALLSYLFLLLACQTCPWRCCLLLESPRESRPP